ncbi:MAG: GNAT family N-acetyltransferase [Dehalococcoidia bacterium]|nr:GNAT family N-acetyltransferase [Dehalococcoidia bacterium]
MPRLEARPVHRQDISEAALLLAGRHRRDRTRLPMLATRFEDKGACAEEIERLAGTPGASGAAALRDGRLVGFAFGEKLLPAPQAMTAQFYPPYTMSVPVLGHAVDDEEDATAVIRVLYAFLAAGWTASGFFYHQAHVVAGDAATQEAWVALGFGRTTTAAVRDTALPVEGAPAAVSLHEGGAEDIDVVMRLDETLFLHHSRSPIFWPMLRETEKSAREFQQGLLAAGGNAHWIAHREGQPVGMQTFMRPGFTPPIVEPDGTVYLFQGVVDEEARGGGVGTAILARSMEWCRAEGHRRCCLHFASGNPSGAPFWLSNHFVPVEHSMLRHVDERIAWANR